MAKNFQTGVSFDTQITNGTIFHLQVEPVGSLPAATSNNKGKMLFLTSDNVLYYSNGTVWVASEAAITYTGSGAIVVTGTVISIDPATTSDPGSMSAADKTKLDNATDAATASRLIIRDASGRAKVVDPAVAGDIATKNYVDTQITANVAGLLDLQGAHDASTAAYPVGALAGDTWYISVAGTISGTVYEVGDVIFANIDSPTSSDWSKLQLNLTTATTTTPGIVELATNGETLLLSSSTVVVTPSNLAALVASESQSGLIQIASTAEVNAGTDNTVAVSPSKLAAYTGAFAKFEQQNLTGTALTTYTITHSIGRRYVHLAIYDSTGQELAVGYTCDSTTQITMSAILSNGASYVVKLIG
jgi:hypothetical protein